jgi:hypothetical protein
MAKQANNLEQSVTASVTAQPAEKRFGPPAGNRNRMTWGGRGWAAIGSYPKGFSAVRRYVGRMRAELESAVCAKYGQIGVYHAAIVQSACRHEGRALLLQRLLRTKDGLPLSDQLALLKEIGSATDSRDKCLQRLGLDAVPKGDDFGQLEARYGLASDDDAWQPHPDGMHETATSSGRAGEGSFAAPAPAVQRRQSGAPGVDGMDSSSSMPSRSPEPQDQHRPPAETPADSTAARGRSLDAGLSGPGVDASRPPAVDGNGGAA